MTPPQRIFLLSPAKAGGPRYSMLLRQPPGFDLACRFQQGEATLGEVYAFISALYFRGKMAYAGAFANASSPGVPSALVIVPGAGLVPLHTPFGLEQLRQSADVPVDESNAVFRQALQDAAHRMDQLAGSVCSYVLLGSVASGKYTGPLLEVFGERLLFPSDFVGRGDMSRGGLMLRAAQSGIELSYVPVQGAVRRGVRPPKLERLPKHT